MATTAKTSEAQRIVDDLVERFGMAGAAIAREIGVKADTIQNIKGRRATGNLQVARLRILRDQMMSAAGQLNTPHDHEPDARPLFEQMPPVADLFKPVQEGDDPAAFQVNADEPAPAPAKTLKDKAGDILGSILGGATVPDAPKAKRTKADDEGQAGLVAQLLPLGALLLVTGATMAIRDPYKPCAPNTQEASAIAYPIIKRAVRELDARKKLSEGTEDAIIILLAVTAYGQRAIGTYRQIHAMEVERDRSNGQPNSHAAGASGFAAIPFAADPARGSGARGGAPVDVAAHAGGSGGQQGRSANGAVGSADERRANASLDALLAADADGRKRLGIG